MLEAGKLQQRLNQLSLAVASFKEYTCTDIAISSINLKIKILNYKVLKNRVFLASEEE